MNFVCKKLFKLTKVHHKMSSAYHPQTTGLIEKYNQTLQRSLVKLVNKEQDNWDIFWKEYFLHTGHRYINQQVFHHLK